MRDTTLPPAGTHSGILQRPYLWVTIGASGLVFLAAFESLAVTTIMPVVSRELHGADLYALAFAGPLATGVIGMVAAGNWSDRHGPTVPLYGSVVLFVAGLLIAGTAVSMPLLVAGRLVQGLGGGALTVALYVLVARIYPGLLHPKIFAAFSAAWVVPSLVGPFAAGMVAQVFSWHWVFLGVVGLVIPALVMIVPVLRNMAPAEEQGAASGKPPPPWALGRLAWASLAALAVLGLNLSREVRLPGFAAAPTLLAVAAVVTALVAVRPLVPMGTLAARRGLPSVILVRGLVAAGFFGAEVYLPYLLIEQYTFSPTFAGLTLTGGALAWAGASAVQGRLGTRLSHRGAVRTGSFMVLAAVLLALATAALHWPPVVVIAGWVLAGGGMGLLYPRLSVMTLALSSKENEGFNSSAMSISDSLGGALALAATGIVFAAFTTTTESFAGVFALCAVLAAAAVAVAPRVTSRAAAR
ncbi:MFS transporter [Arthrobacter sp. SLBN-100]|uniref:MFS transporter n=1 Tax=Arthrobacter sp. SLBN-100 TaxID=2768450 RepID=UPI001F47C1B2|nr:MFS transporter [Arthrobacter sp. SLBN-100]